MKFDQLRSSTSYKVRLERLRFCRCGGRPNIIVIIRTMPIVTIGAAKAINTGIVWTSAAELTRKAPDWTVTVPDVAMKPTVQMTSNTANKKRMDDTRSQSSPTRSPVS